MTGCGMSASLKKGLRAVAAVVAGLGLANMSVIAKAEQSLIELAKDPKQWVMPAKNYASTRYSELNQINTGNVANLQVAWTFSTGAPAGHEAAPLIIGNVMYVISPYAGVRPNQVFALDATNGDLKWSY